MFNLGGAMKNITEKAEGLVEEKKHAAAALLEHQVKETGEFFARTMTEAEGKAVNAAEEAKRAAVDGFDKEVEKIGNAALQEVSTAVDDKMKQADELMNEKRDALGEPAKSMFSKAKGLFG